MLWCDWELLSCVVSWIVWGSGQIRYLDDEGDDVDEDAVILQREKLAALRQEEGMEVDIYTCRQVVHRV